MNFTKLVKKYALVAMILSLSTVTLAQEEEGEGLVISGSADIYYTYDFSGNDNIGTSFADNRNSLSLGMLDLGLSHSVGKASFVGELSFGPRSFKSIPVFDPDRDGSGPNIFLQNLYASYAFTDVISVTAGYMGTFVGYEVISPAGNFNYSTSYLFTNGPFQNSGVKADFAISDKFAFMVGLFNDWNIYYDDNGMLDFGAQIYVSPVDGWDVYLNFVTGDPSGTVLDLTTGFQITDAFYLGLNAADYNISGDGKGGYSGVAIYPQLSLSDAVSIGYRGDFFSYKEFQDETGAVTSESANVFSSTLTANITAWNLTFIPEVRLDAVSDDFFLDGDDLPTSQASQVTFAAVYAF